MDNTNNTNNTNVIDTTDTTANHLEQFATAMVICAAVDGVLMGSGALYHFLSKRSRTPVWQNNDWDIFCLNSFNTRGAPLDKRLDFIQEKLKAVLGPSATFERKSHACCQVNYKNAKYDVVATCFDDIDKLFDRFDLNICCIATNVIGTVFGKQFNADAALGSIPCTYNVNAARTPQIKDERIAKYKSRGYCIAEVDGIKYDFTYN